MIVSWRHLNYWENDNFVAGQQWKDGNVVFCVEMIIYYISEYYRVIIQYLDSNV